MLYSFFEGDKVIEDKENFKEIIIEDDIPLRLTQSGIFYIEKMIYEFEYLYQMALSSLMLSEYVDELSNCYQFEKELTVLRFLESIFKMLKIDIENVDENRLRHFRDLFYHDNKNCKPYRKMLKAFVSVMNNKVQRADQKESKDLNKLRDLLKSAKELEREAVDYFLLKIGG
jgi:hypothetical protein